MCITWYTFGVQIVVFGSSRYLSFKLYIRLYQQMPPSNHYIFMLLFSLLANRPSSDQDHVWQTSSPCERMIWLLYQLLALCQHYGRYHTWKLLAARITRDLNLVGRLGCRPQTKLPYFRRSYRKYAPYGAWRFCKESFPGWYDLVGNAHCISDIEWLQWLQNDKPTSDGWWWAWQHSAPNDQA